MRWQRSGNAPTKGVPLCSQVLVYWFCVFVAGWRHALRSEWPFIIIIIGLLITLKRHLTMGRIPGSRQLSTRRGQGPARAYLWGSLNTCTTAGTGVLISAGAHNSPPPIAAARNAFNVCTLGALCTWQINNNNNRRLVTLAEHTSDHGRQTWQINVLIL